MPSAIGGGEGGGGAGDPSIEQSKTRHILKSWDLVCVHNLKTEFRVSAPYCLMFSPSSQAAVSCLDPYAAQLLCPVPALSPMPRS